jgi:hypothetical protein
VHPYDNSENLLRVLEPLRRNNYFYGKRMDVQHFQMEQGYGKLKQWLLNRLTLGKGVVCGLKVSIDGHLICVDPGFAIDGLGREIVVPVRACIDPVTQEGGCCAPCCRETGATPAPAVQPQPEAQPHALAVGLSHEPVTPGAAQPEPQPEPRPQPPQADGAYTLWLCYRECRTDYQPVLVSDCGTREQCAPGTIIETFCLKMTPGVPPLQADPEWCAKLWPKPKEFGDRPAATTVLRAAPSLGGAAARVPTEDEAGAALTSRRRILCELFDGPCDPAEGDPCVPLAVVGLRDNRVVGFETCVVRPRVYSNAVLLDLILCLADKIEECCDHEGTAPQTLDLLRVKSVEFLGGPRRSVIATVQSPLAQTQVPVDKQGDAIRVRFTKPIDTGAKAPTTPGLNDPNWRRHNVLVLPEPNPRFGLEYVPGKLTIEAPDTLLWELNRESRFWATQLKGWQKGRLRLAIFGDGDAGVARAALADTAGGALDGEPIAPAGGAMSGNGSPGGTFVSIFTVG